MTRPETRNTDETGIGDRLLDVPYRLADRFDVPPLVAAAYWRIEAAYCAARIAALGGTIDVRVDDETVRFALSTRLEYRRARDLGGERGVIATLLDDLDGTETVWDVGACVGTYTCFVGSALTTGRVVGFEPEPTNLARLRTNLTNNVPAERWTTAGVALSDRDGASSFSSEHAEAGGGHHYLSTEGAAPTVETRRGDSLVDAGFDAPDILKIDVQGAELGVLDGMGALLETVETIYLEVHPEKCGRYGTIADEIETFLDRNSYSITWLGEPTNRRSGVYFVRAHR